MGWGGGGDGGGGVGVGVKGSVLCVTLQHVVSIQSVLCVQSVEQSPFTMSC